MSNVERTDLMDKHVPILYFVRNKKVTTIKEIGESFDIPDGDISIIINGLQHLHLVLRKGKRDQNEIFFIGRS